MDTTTVKRYARGLFACDFERRRIWIANQRLHHGLTGALLATVGLTGLASRRFTPRGGLEWAILGTALMAHDWHDRSVWFRRGPQDV